MSKPVQSLKKYKFTLNVKILGYTKDELGYINIYMIRALNFRGDGGNIS